MRLANMSVSECSEAAASLQDEPRVSLAPVNTAPKNFTHEEAEVAFTTPINLVLVNDLRDKSS